MRFMWAGELPARYSGPAGASHALETAGAGCDARVADHPTSTLTNTPYLTGPHLEEDSIALVNRRCYYCPRRCRCQAWSENQAAGQGSRCHWGLVGSSRSGTAAAGAVKVFGRARQHLLTWTHTKHLTPGLG